MNLFFSLICPDGSVRKHNVLGVELEYQLDMLNMLVADGNTLLSAVIIDEDGVRTNLPLEAFDGQSVSKSIKRLKVEYKLLVSP